MSWLTSAAGKTIAPAGEIEKSGGGGGGDGVAFVAVVAPAAIFAEERDDLLEHPSTKVTSNSARMRNLGFLACARSMTTIIRHRVRRSK
jgi:hypothetical protein